MLPQFRPTTFLVTLDFGDFAKTHPKQIEGFTELSQYLEKVPDMCGFLCNGKVDISIEMVDPNFPCTGKIAYHVEAVDTQFSELPFTHLDRD